MSIDTEMTAPAHAPVRTDWPAGFGSLLRAEWTKFRTVRGWVIGMIVGAILFVFLGVFAASNVSIGCGAQKTGRACLPAIPIGPGGEAVTDTFYFVRQSLSGNGSITTRVIAMTGMHSQGISRARVGSSPGQGMTPGLVPWSKAGIIIKASTKLGSSYAAMMVTGGHGVRMQYDYTNDIAGLPGTVSATAPRWLRLKRSGDTITGYDSPDGVNWTRVGAATLAGLPRDVQVGLFATSPRYIHISPFFGGASVQAGPSVATGVFDRVHLTGATSAGSWTGQAIGLNSNPDEIGLGSFHQANGTLTVSGSGDIGPIVPGPGGGYPTATIEQSLVGAFIGLIAIVVIAAMFFTSEYRRGLIRTTLAATPRRGQVLAAKAVVIAVVAFVVGLVASVASIALGVPRERADGQFVLPVSALTEVRVIVGTAALLAVAAVLALCLGTLFRRSAAAITVGIVVIVLPFLFSAVGIFPSGVSAWLLRLTPAAGFAVEQSIPQYPQVSRVYSPGGGYYPLAPWAGFAVLCAWAAVAAALAVIALRRRDA